jgi:flagellar biosynthesis/type III secretory pathway protein FliH
MATLDDLFEHNPYVQKKKEEGREIGHKEGLTEGLQKAFVVIVHRRFPPLTELAQQRIAKITKPDQLDLLLGEIVSAPDEAVARWILSTIATL